MLKEGDLVSAYKKAGTSFGGLLQQNFVVMHDLNRTGVGAWGGKGAGAGGKQLRSEKKRGRNERQNPKKPSGRKENEPKAARKK